jgi:hypothetical protein
VPLGGQGLHEDQLAFLREERDYRNFSIAKLRAATSPCCAT